MPVITENEIRSLATVKSNGSAVTSCYLDIDGGRYVRQVDYERVLDQMLRRARADAVDDDTVRDLDRVEEFLKRGFDRSTVRGLAVFSSSANDLWQVVELPVRVRSELIVNSAPAVGQLEAVWQQATTIGVLAVDKARARVFVFRLGELIEHTEMLDERDDDDDTPREHGRGGVEEHREELEHQHLRNAAALAWSAHQTHGFDHVVVAASDKHTALLEGDLHPYLRERLHSRLAVEPSSPHATIRDAALELAEQIEVEREATLVDQLRDAVSSGGLGVAGIDDVLAALAEQRIDRLLVSDGYAVEGWHCPTCNRFAMVGRTCTCGTEMDHVADVIEHAVDDALAQSCHVDVCIDNADLDVLGRVGALLRY